MLMHINEMGAVTLRQPSLFVFCRVCCETNNIALFLLAEHFINSPLVFSVRGNW